MKKQKKYPAHSSLNQQRGVAESRNVLVIGLEST